MTNRDEGIAVKHTMYSLNGRNYLVPQPVIDEVERLTTQVVKYEAVLEEIIEQDHSKDQTLANIARQVRE